MAYFTVNGHRLYYEAAGTGEPALLLHAGLGSVQEWQPQLAAFSNRYRVIAADRWGYGQSDPRPAFEDDFFEADAAEQVALLDTLGVDAAHVVGHSDGGTIALLMGATYPHRVRSLAVEAAHVFGEEETLTRLRSYGGPDSWPPPLLRYLERQHGDKAVALGAAWLSKWSSPNMAHWDIRAILGQIKAPTLIIQADTDELSTMNQVHAIHAGIAGSQVWVVDGAGHTPHLERPEEFNRRLLVWLRQHERR